MNLVRKINQSLCSLPATTQINPRVFFRFSVFTIWKNFLDKLWTKEKEENICEFQFGSVFLSPTAKLSPQTSIYLKASASTQGKSPLKFRKSFNFHNLSYFNSRGFIFTDRPPPCMAESVSWPRHLVHGSGGKATDRRHHQQQRTLWNV